MRSAFALRIFSGKNIYNFAFVALCGALQTHFHGRGWNELPQSKPNGFASSLWEGASGAPGNFALEPETVPLCQGPHPRGGWHRAAMTGGVFPPTEKGCLPSGRQPFPEENKENTRPKGQSEYQNILSSL